jgi:hypothetical protein
VKRISISIVVLGAVVLGAIAIASAGTSTVTTPCRSATANHDCIWGQELPTGTVVRAKLAPEYRALLSTTNKNSGNLAICNESEITATLYGTPSHVNVEGPVSISFGACSSEKRMETLETEGHVISWLPGSDAGEISMPYNRIMTHTESVGLHNCEYELPPGKIFGGGLGEGYYWEAGPKIYYRSTIFGGEEVVAKKKGGEAGCPAAAYFSATYQITSPAPLYIENT